MRLLARIVVAVLANAVALLAAASFVDGFRLSADFRTVLLVAVVFTALNFFLKRILQLFLGPVIILTLGLGFLLVNMFLLYLLDILSPDLTIETISAFILGAVVIGLVNFIFHLATKTK